MLVQILTHGANGRDVMANSGSMARGFAVNTNAANSHWLDMMESLQEFNRNPTELDVQDAATSAGQSSVSKVLYQDYLNYRLETATNVASMWQSEMSAMGRMAGLSAQVAQSQDRMVQQFASSAYQIGKSAAYTQGITNGYAQGLQFASGIM